ncbi:unnamed protein product, partial [Urochloa humidicola]
AAASTGQRHGRGFKCLSLKSARSRRYSADLVHGMRFGAGVAADLAEAMERSKMELDVRFGIGKTIIWTSWADKEVRTEFVQQECKETGAIVARAWW